MEDASLSPLSATPEYRPPNDGRPMVMRVARPVGPARRWPSSAANRRSLARDFSRPSRRRTGVRTTAEPSCPRPPGAAHSSGRSEGHQVVVLRREPAVRPALRPATSEPARAVHRRLYQSRTNNDQPTPQAQERRVSSPLTESVCSAGDTAGRQATCATATGDLGVRALQRQPEADPLLVHLRLAREAHLRRIYDAEGRPIEQGSSSGSESASRPVAGFRETREGGGGAWSNGCGIAI